MLHLPQILPRPPPISFMYSAQNLRKPWSYSWPETSSDLRLKANRVGSSSAWVLAAGLRELNLSSLAPTLPPQCCWVYIYFFYQTISSGSFGGQGKHLFLLFYPFHPEHGHLIPNPWSALESQRGSDVGKAMVSQSCLWTPLCLLRNRPSENIDHVGLAVGCAQTQFLK